MHSYFSCSIVISEHLITTHHALSCICDDHYRLNFVRSIGSVDIHQRLGKTKYSHLSLYDVFNNYRQLNNDKHFVI